MVTNTLITNILNLIALSLAIWLGFYVITYSPRRLISWLTGLTLWSISGIFLNMLLAITPPPTPANLQNWQILLFPFWAPDVFQTGASGWLSGWLATPAIAFWHHITVLLREEKPSNWFKVQILVVYLLAGITISSQLNSNLMFSAPPSDPLNLSFVEAGAYYIAFMSLLFVLSGISAYNIWVAAHRTRSTMVQSQMKTLFIATCFAGLTAPVSLLALVKELEVPRVVNTLLLAATIIMIGLSITRYSALIEGRLIRRDFIYNAAVVCLILIIYLSITWIAVNVFNFPGFTFIYVTVLAIITHSMVDIARRYLSDVFLQKEEKNLRSELLKLARSDGDNLENAIETMLQSVCSAIRATYAILFKFEGKKATATAFYNWQMQNSQLKQPALLADDLEVLKPGHFSPPLSDVAVLVPMYQQSNQIGAIIFGQPVNGLAYTTVDMDLILESCDLIAESIPGPNSKSGHRVQAEEIYRTIQSPPRSTATAITPKIVEDLLRNVLDFAYLGNSEFAQIPLVCGQLPPNGETHIDRGKCVYTILAAVVEKLRPQNEPGRNPPPREWHPYLILQWAYFEDKLNRDIMSELYISEGTFNRTRRAALRSVSRALEEMAQATPA